MSNIIADFSGEYSFLSNFYRYEFQVYIPSIDAVVTVPTAEHAYQAFKPPGKVSCQEILCARTPGKAKRLGQECVAFRS